MKPVASGAGRTAAGASQRRCAGIGCQPQTSRPPTRTREPVLLRTADFAAYRGRRCWNPGRYRQDKAQLRGPGRRADWVVVEGAGGWLAPVGPNAGDGGSAARTRRAGTARGGAASRVPESRATVAAARSPRAASGSAGWIASGVDASFARAAENLAALERLLHEAPLAVVPHTSGAASLLLAHGAARLAQRVTDLKPPAEVASTL